MSSIFDSDPEVTTTQTRGATVPITYETPRSFSLTGDSGSLNMDPSNIRVNSGVPSMLGRLGDLRGNENAFIRARVSPYQEALQRRIADVDRGLAMRGVTGSLRTNEVNNTMLMGNREIANQTALAQQEAISAEQQVLQQAIAQELATMGLGLEGLRLALGDRRQTSQAIGGTQTQTTSGGGSFIDSLSGLASIYGAVTGN